MTGETMGSANEYRLKYTQPYRFDLLLAFFKTRAMAGVELVEDGSYSRTVRIADDEGAEKLGWVRVENGADNANLLLTLSESLLSASQFVLERVSRQFDLACNPVAVYEGLSGLEELAPGANVPGTRLPGCFDPFETACRAVLGQQVTVAAANKLAARVVQAFGTPLETGVPGLTYAFPTAQQIASMEDIEGAFGQLGVIKSRSRTIQSIARGLVSGELDFSLPCDAPQQIQNLLAIKGIGPWSANYIAMRCLGYADAFLETDAGIKHALPQFEPKERLALAEQWRPWRSYANICLWNSLTPKE